MLRMLQPTKLNLPCLAAPTCTARLLMAHSNHYHHVAIAVAVAAFLAAGEASGVGFKLHHRSSSVVRRWAEARGRPLGVRWPAHGSPEYYSELSRHDRALLSRRGLAGADGLLSFAAGNDTYRINSLGFLYYAEVSVGTPNKTFLVALDTGSDLFWVPCDCRQCAPLDGGNSTDLRPYSPRESTTSRQVTCDNALCDRPNACGAATDGGSCPYAVRYVSANTSSSGVLVEDLLHLTREGPGPGGEALQAPVVFGCGKVQTGAFLEGGSPDGLFGLGMGKVSVPSVLARSGLVATDSFSMCFSEDGVGRINFGDAGSPGQKQQQAETPFIVGIGSFHRTYNVSFTSVNVGSESSAVEFTAVMDSGTSFTYLNEPEYTALAASFNSQVRERRSNFSSTSGGSLPLEYCYELRGGQTEVVLPKVSLTTNNSGGAVFPVLRPIITIFGQVRPVGYCLAILKNDISVNIIGQNFMTGLKLVFDRQRNVLGWKEFDCYESEAGAPGAAPAPTTTTTLKPREKDGNNRYPGAVPVLPRSASSANLRRGQPPSLLLLVPLLLLAALHSC